MADISKLKLSGSVYNIKDAKGRADVSTLLGDHSLAALGTAAWVGMDNTPTADSTNAVTSGGIKSYVDGAISAIAIGEVIIDNKKGGSGADKDQPITAASADTYRKLYLVPDNAATGSYVEWLTIRNGAEGSYTYSWEQIGTTQMDLSGYVQKTQTIAGIDLQDNITVEELQTALELGALAYKNEGSVTVETADDLTMDSYTPAGDVTLNAFTQTSTTATISEKADYTPAGTITGEAIKDGSINVTVKDAASKSEAALTYGAYTPAGSVSLTKDNNGAFQVSGTIDKPEINVDDSSVDTFVKSLKAGDTDAATFTEGAFTPASIADGFFSAGSQASYEHTGFDGGSFEKGSAVSANTDAIKAHVASGAEITGDVDGETLVFEAAATAEVMNHNASFTAATYGTDTFVANTLPSIDTTKFNGGSKAADTFSANKLPVIDGTATAVTAVTAELAAAPTFTGDKFNPAFAGTEVAEMKVTKAEYFKQEIDAATFTGTAATLGFSGTKSEQLIPTEVKYDKATANGASFTGTAEVLTGTLNKTEKTVDVVFE